MADVGGKPLYLNAMEKTDRLEKAAFKVVVTGSPVIAEAGRRPGISGGGELSAGDGNFPVGCSWHRGRPKAAPDGLLLWSATSRGFGKLP